MGWIEVNMKASAELLSAVAAMESIDSEMRSQIRRHVQRIADPEFRKAIDTRARSKLERRVIADTSLVTVTASSVRVSSASYGGPLRNGLLPARDYPAVEFGVDPKNLLIYKRRARGSSKATRVRRRIGTAFAARRKEGPFYGAGREMAPRLVSMYVQTVVRTIGEALDGRT